MMNERSGGAAPFHLFNFVFFDCVVRTTLDVNLNFCLFIDIIILLLGKWMGVAHGSHDKILTKH